MPFNKDNTWRPNLKQERFLAVPKTIKEAGYLGGAGSGKSEILLMYAIANNWHGNPRFKQVFMRRTFPELRKEIVPRSREIYTRFGATFNKTEMCWTFPREDQYGGTGMGNMGGNVYLGHCENETDVSKYDSMEINLFTPDEVTTLTEYIYLYIGFTRVRTSDPDLPAIIRCAGMPGGIGHTWVNNRFIKPWPEGGKILRGKGGNKRIFIFATLADNKDHIDPNYSQSLEALSESEKRAKKYGDWSAYEGQVFSEFREKHYPSEPDNALHIVPEFDIPDWWPRICAIDWGYAAMCSIGWGAISPQRKLYVYRHQMFFGKKIEEWAPEVKYYVDKDNPLSIIICHSANQHRGDPHTILEQVTEALGTSITLGEKDRVGGKALLHEYLRWQAKPVPTSEVLVFDQERASWLLRNSGMIEYNKYLSLFQPAPIEDNLPRLLFMDRTDVRVICDAIKSCVYAKSGNDGKKKEDVAEFAGDDPYDMLRMLLHSADSFFGTAIEAQQKLEKTQAVVAQLQATNDMTGFYRNMRRIESEEVVMPVKRFHRAQSRMH